MSDKKLSPQEAKKQREEQRRQELERMRALFQVTVPPGEKSIIEQNLEKLQSGPKESESQVGLTLSTEEIVPPDVAEKLGDRSGSPPTHAEVEPQTISDGRTEGEPTVLEPPRIEDLEVRPVGAAKSNFGNHGTDEREGTYKELARQLRESKKRREVNGIRLHVAVTSDVFSAVSEFAFAERLDKVEILTFLLHKHLPKAPYEAVPRWMLPESDETTVKDFALPYRQDQELENAFRHLEHRVGLYRVDIVEAIVTRFLPAAKGLVRPKRRVRARVRAKLGVR